MKTREEMAAGEKGGQGELDGQGHVLHVGSTRAPASLLLPEEGVVHIEGREATRGRELLLQPERRGVGLVFQELTVPYLRTFGDWQRRGPPRRLPRSPGC